MKNSKRIIEKLNEKLIEKHRILKKYYKIHQYFMKNQQKIQKKQRKIKEDLT